MDYQDLSKEISYALRHAPWEYELELDDEGFVPIDQLLAAINEGSNYDRHVVESDLDEIIRSSDKQHHEIVGTKIRALYGHTTPVKIARTAAEPPKILYHGTARRFCEAIMAEGLKPMARHYVHLSVDVDTAKRVGSRRDSSPALLEVDAMKAFEDGLVFYRGNDKVWLADAIPPKYLRRIG